MRIESGGDRALAAPSAIPRVDPLARSSRLKRLAAQAARSSAGLAAAGWYLEHVVSRIEPAVSRWSRGRLTSLPIAPVVFLHSVGGRTGRGRITPLTYFTDGADVILIASNNGRPKHPAWYHNIKAHPAVTLRAREREGRYIAREAEGGDRERLWSLAIRATPPLSTYATKVSPHLIPIIRCVPAS